MPSPVRPLISINFAPNALLERPTLAAHIAVVGSMWARIETSLGMLLAAIIGAEARSVIAIYHALTSAPAQRAALEAAASVRLNEAQQRRLAMVLKEVTARGKERNGIVHGSWGLSENVPDGIILADPRDEVKYEVIDRDHAQAMVASGMSVGDSGFANLAELQKRFLIYKERDFVEVHDRLWRSFRRLQDFSEPFIDHWYRGDPEPVSTIPLQPE